MLLQKIDGVPPSVAQASGGVVASTAQRPTEPKPTGATVPVASAEPAPPSPDAVRAAVANANRSIQSLTHALEFEVDPDTKKIVVRLVDTQDKHVLRQVPSQEMLEIARALDRMQSLLVRGKA